MTNGVVFLTGASTHRRLTIDLDLRGCVRATVSALLLVFTTLAGCSPRHDPTNAGMLRPAGFANAVSAPERPKPNIAEHVIVVDGQGRPHDPTAANSDAPSLSIGSYRAQIANMFRAMDAFHQGRPEKKVLIFVHGGLNGPAESLQHASEEIQPIMDAGYYPIFLNWNSDLFDTYGEHAARITQSVTDDNFVRRLVMPLYFLSDTGRALTRAPVVWSSELTNDFLAFSADFRALGHNRDPNRTVQSQDLDSERWANRRYGKQVANAFKVLRRQQLEEQKALKPGEARREMRICIGPDLSVSAGRMAARGSAYVLTAPTKFGLSWTIDLLGTPAWQNMSRRTLVAFDGQLGGNPGEPEYQPADNQTSESRAQRTADAQNFDSTGALEVFREEFLKVVKDHHATTQPGFDYQVTLIAHSAGALVLNEWLRRDLLEQKNQLYANIVYLAAACSVRDFNRAVIPYLIVHHDAQFYNLMLHPLADIQESEETHDILQRGSLLVWLDEFLTDPQTPLDRTLGRWDNIVPAVELIPRRVRGQITLKAFALAPYDVAPPPPGEPDYGPQVHGQFRGRPYWCPEFWQSESPVIPGMDCRPH